MTTTLIPVGKATDTFTYAYTGLQSVSALTDKNGAVVSNYTYAAWGIYAQTASNLTGCSY